MRNGESWLYIDEELAHFWDYFTDDDALLTNTELLFTGASRPYFDFFMKRITHTVTADDARQLEELKAEAQRLDPTRTVLITANDRVVTGIAGLENIRKIFLNDKRGLLNIEPAWRELRLKLNGVLCDTVLVNLGPERAFILPRLAQVYGVRALDLRAWGTLLPARKKSLMHRAYQKIARKFR